MKQNPRHDLKSADAAADGRGTTGDGAEKKISDEQRVVAFLDERGKGSHAHHFVDQFLLPLPRRRPYEFPAGTRVIDVMGNPPTKSQLEIGIMPYFVLSENIAPEMLAEQCGKAIE